MSPKLCDILSEDLFKYVRKYLNSRQVGMNKGIQEKHVKYYEMLAELAECKEKV